MCFCGTRLLVHVHTHTYMSISLSMRIHIVMFICICKYVYMYIYIHTQTSRGKYTEDYANQIDYENIRMYMHGHVYVDILIHRKVNVCMYTYAHVSDIPLILYWALEPDCRILMWLFVWSFGPLFSAPDPMLRASEDGGEWDDSGGRASAGSVSANGSLPQRLPRQFWAYPCVVKTTSFISVCICVYIYTE